jgi:hypothetical protein
MARMRNRLLLITALVIAGLAALAWWRGPAWLVAQLEVRPGLLTLQPSLGGAGPGAGGGIAEAARALLSGEVAVGAHVRVRNGTWLDLKVRDLAWRAFVSGRQVAEGTLSEPLLLPSDREVPVKLEATVSVVSLGLAVADLLQLRSADLAVEVDATAEVFGLSARRTMRLEGFDLRLDQSGLFARPQVTDNEAPENAPPEGDSAAKPEGDSAP